MHAYFARITRPDVRPFAMQIRALFVITFLLLFVAPPKVLAQDLSGIDSALLPLPHSLQAEASILARNPQGSFEVLKDGSNNYFCLKDQPDDDRFSVECHPQAMRAYQERKSVLVQRQDRASRDSLLAQELKSKTLHIPNGALSYFLSGNINKNSGVPDSVWAWSEIAVPFTGPAASGLPTENMGEAPWLMNANDYDAHIMVDYAFVPWKRIIHSDKDLH